MDIISKLKNQTEHLRPSEKKVANIILADLNFAANASIGDLAEKANVSHASITRLAKAIGCTNVRDFKVQIAKSLAIAERFTSNEPVRKKEIPEIYNSIIRSLEHNAGLIDEATITRAVNIIAKTKHALIYGVGGGSTIMSKEFHNRIFRLGVYSNAYSDPMLMRMTASNISKGDCVICLSLGGYSPDVEAAALIAKEYDAVIISICPEGSLSKISDIHIPIEIKETEYIFKPSTSRYVMMAVIDIIASELAVKNQKKSRDKLRRLKHHLDKHRPGPDRLPLGD